MQKQLLLDMLAQNQTTCWSTFDTVTPENGAFRLNQQTSSAGFMLRHVGELFVLFGFFFGLPTAVQNTTMGHSGISQGEDITGSWQLIGQGYDRFRNYIDTTPNSA